MDMAGVLLQRGELTMHCTMGEDDTSPPRDSLPLPVLAREASDCTAEIHHWPRAKNEWLLGAQPNMGHL